jgi:Amidohydrolase
MRFARRDLGFRGGFIRPNPYNDRKLHDPAYDPLWSAAEDLDFSIGIHEGGNSGMPTVGIDRFEGRGAQHIISHTMEMMRACMSMIWGGVCERHPKLIFEGDPMTPRHGQEGRGATPAKFPRETDASLTVPPPRGPLVYERDREFECRHKKSASRCRPSTKMAARAIIISGM